MTCATLARTAVSDADPAVLDAIALPNTALAIWNRARPATLAAVLDALDLDAVDDVVTQVAVDAAFDAFLRDAGYPEEAAVLLAGDIAMLVRSHVALTGADRLSLRLEVIETDACRRFHADYVTLRLLCTYVGPGTEWHPVDAPDQVERVPTGAVAVFKGRLLLDPPTLRHRSPPIAAKGGRRLMLAIDPARAVGR